jgi:hypothetical protein
MRMICKKLLNRHHELRQVWQQRLQRSDWRMAGGVAVPYVELFEAGISI